MNHGSVTTTEPASAPRNPAHQQNALLLSIFECPCAQSTKVARGVHESGIEMNSSLS